MAYLHRLKTGDYTDSDIASFYITNRFDFGPFIREVGDFVAHSDRDRGDCFNTVIRIYSQMAFFLRYQGDNKKPIEPFGDCEWWLKPYFERKAESYSPAELKKNLKMSKSELKKKIGSWFPDNEQFPTRIEAVNPFEFYYVADFFSRLIDFNTAFQKRDVVAELGRAFRKIGLTSIDTNDFLMGTAVLLHGLKFELPEGVTARIEIGIFKPQEKNDPSDGLEAAKTDGTLVVTRPVRPLEIIVRTQTPRKQALADLQSTILNTEIDPDMYFDPLFAKHHGPPDSTLVFPHNLQFVSKGIPKVTTF